MKISTVRAVKSLATRNIPQNVNVVSSVIPVVSNAVVGSAFSFLRMVEGLAVIAEGLTSVSYIDFGYRMQQIMTW